MIKIELRLIYVYYKQNCTFRFISKKKRKMSTAVLNAVLGIFFLLGLIAIYMPQYFKQNNPIIKLGMKNLAPELEMQYQNISRELSHLKLVLFKNPLS